MDEYISNQPNFIPKFINSNILIKTTSPNACIPKKNFETNVGYDITLIERCGDNDEDSINSLTEFDTGLIIHPPVGHYLIVYSNNNLIESGYDLACGPKIIDSDYSGTLKIFLRKIEDVDDMKLPFCCLKMIVQPIIFAHLAVPVVKKPILSDHISTNGKSRKKNKEKNFLN